MAERDRFLVLHALVVKGIAGPEDLATLTGVDENDLRPLLEELSAEGLVKLRTGRIAGYLLTPAGREAHPALLAEQVPAAEREGIETAYEGFLPLNGSFKETCTRWQMKAGPDGDQQVNDHADAGYDAAVVDDLAGLHERVLTALEPAVDSAAHFRHYPERFKAALARVQNGDGAAFARPMSNSYHDVWMELHQDFLVTLGRPRGAEDGH